VVAAATAPGRSPELAGSGSGVRPELLSSSEREEIRRLRKENYELRRANEILKSASVYFAKELDPDRPK
jgi:transposase